MTTGKIASVALTSLLATSICMAIPGNAHAGKVTLPKEILGTWCSDRNGRYLRNGLDTPCDDNTDRRIIIDANGNYGGQDLECKAIKVTIIDHGHVHKGTPGADAVYGVISRCESDGGTGKARIRIEVERWGSALTIK